MLGIYDSGIGGVAVLERLQTVSPDLNYIYLADQALFPIGQKDQSEVITRLKKVFDFFISKNCQEVLLACNTVSTIYAVNHKQFSQYKKSLKIFTITGPTVNLLNEYYDHLKLKKGVMIATTATISSNYYQIKLSNFKNLKYTYLAKLAWAIESQDYNEIRQSLLNNSHLDWSTTDFIILGCTHYTWIKPIFMFLNPSMQVIDPVSESIGFLAKSLSLDISQKPIQKFYSTGSRLKVEDRHYKFKKISI